MNETHADCGGCAACQGLADSTPTEIANRPGLAAIAYRPGTYSRFRASMLAGLTREGRPALAALKTREADDFSLALIDAWSVAADVLTFYTERIANEHYLGTATERRSVAEMVSLIGYRLAPGVAAEAWLAFALETAPGAPLRSTIPTASRVQTLAGPGEIPQTFETTETITAIGSWNRPQPRILEPRIPRTGDEEVLLAGAATGVRRGDRLLFVADDWTATSSRWNTVRVVGIVPDAASQTTSVRFAPALTGIDLDGSGVGVYALRAKAALFGYNAPNPLLFEATVLGQLEGPGPGEVDPTSHEWNFAEITGQELHLDGLYEGVEPGSWAVLTTGATSLLAEVDGVGETAASDYAVSARVSTLHLDRTDTDLAGFGGPQTRTTMVSFRSEALPLAEVRITAPVAGDLIALAHELPAVTVPRRILIRGARARAAQGTGAIVDGIWPGAGSTPIVVSIDASADLGGLVRWVLRPDDGDDVTILGEADAVVHIPAEPGDEIVGETAVALAAPEPEESDPIDAIALEAPLSTVYDTQGDAPVEIFGNVAAATHGETVSAEVLGSGDGTRAFQRFVLRKKPVTYVQAATATGGESTLEVRVNGVLWHEVPTMFSAKPADRIFVSAQDDIGTTTVTFGDGVTGARLPTGIDNVVAGYRAGLGLAGAARADQISQALTRPLGLKSVTNPLPAGGAQDGQQSEDARTNAPRSVLTLGRVVSLQDYADFSAEFAGIAKASSTWTWDGSSRGVFVTVAAADGRPTSPGSSLLDNLRTGLRAVGDARVRLDLSDFQPATFSLLGLLRVAADYEPDRVRAAVSARLLERYSFAARTFGEGVSLSELVHAIHQVAGVDAVRVDRLHRDDEPVGVSTFLVAAAPRAGGPPGVPGAEILTLVPENIALEVGW
ncbi:putative baseplate assembly protein [Microbacterium sp. DT81.1]|uniref:putative baseplate assembly protein n=1 Tax=Microbacterium sp. DT81.1 TaxID=3393413 RepID=UPI003CF51014